MAQTFVRPWTAASGGALALCAAICIASPALAQTASPALAQTTAETPLPAAPSLPADPTSLIDVPPPPPVWPKIPPELLLMSSQCSVPDGDLATPAPGFARTIDRLTTTKKLRILAIGSSSTWGVGASNMKRNYPSRLEAILSNVWKGVELEIVNRGVGGEVAAQTGARLLDEMKLVQPDLVLWQVGTNDALHDVPLEQYEKTVRGTIAEVRKQGVDIVLVGLQYTPKYARHEHYFRIRRIMDEISTSEKILYVRRYRAMEFIATTKANLQMMAADNFHLNDLGYQCMAEHVAQAVVANLFVRRRDKPAAPAAGLVAGR